MKSSTKSNKWMASVSTMLLTAVLLAGTLVTDNAGVLPPNSKAFGKSYSEWSANWWQWLMSQPVDNHPGNDSPDFDVTDGQSGQVWFLTGPFGTIERSISIPAGT